MVAFMTQTPLSTRITFEEFTQRRKQRSYSPLKGRAWLCLQLKCFLLLVLFLQ